MYRYLLLALITTKVTPVGGVTLLIECRNQSTERDDLDAPISKADSMLSSTR